jgi:hypothetical protein
MRFSALALFAATLLVSGCKKKETAPTSEPTGSAAPMTKPVTPPAADPTPAAPAAPATPGPVVGWEKMADIQLPTPKGVPEKGMWSAGKATKDGDRLDNFVDGSDYWISMRMLDCNLPMVQEAATKSADERGLLDYCFATPTGKLKDFPLIAKNDSVRAVKAGHVVLIASLGAAGEGKLKAADLEAYLESLDLASISKL